MVIRVGNNAYNTKFFRSIHLTEDEDCGVLKIIAVNDRGQKITLKSTDIYTRPEREARRYINDWFDTYLKMMEEV